MSVVLTLAASSGVLSEIALSLQIAIAFN